MEHSGDPRVGVPWHFQSYFNWGLVRTTAPIQQGHGVERLRTVQITPGRPPEKSPNHHRATPRHPGQLSLVIRTNQLEGDQWEKQEDRILPDSFFILGHCPEAAGLLNLDGARYSCSPLLVTVLGYWHCFPWSCRSDHILFSCPGWPVASSNKQSSHLSPRAPGTGRSETPCSGTPGHSMR